MHPNERIRQLEDALVVAIEALEAYTGGEDSETLEWLERQLNDLSYDRAARERTDAAVQAAVDAARPI